MTKSTLRLVLSLLISPGHHEHPYSAGSDVHRLECLAKDGAGRRRLGQHGVARCGRGAQQIADADGGTAGVHLAAHDAGHGHRGEGFFELLPQPGLHR